MRSFNEYDVHSVTMKRKQKDSLPEIYSTLYEHYGDLHWWPAKTPYEVIVGAILTQNTAWSNVEKAIEQFGDDISPERVRSMPIEELQQIIRPAGFYKQKSLYLKAITDWYASYNCDTEFVKGRTLSELRRELLKVHGVGNETADSILLYGFDLPTFVVDAYTMRLFNRFPVDAGENYLQVKEYCEALLPKDPLIYNRCHALIVMHCKDYCKKKPLCMGCPLEDRCKSSNQIKL